MNIDNKLWGGRFLKKSNQLFTKFNCSLKIDYHLVEQDIFGSIAWSKSLLECNVLTTKEQKKIELALCILKQDVKKNKEKILNSTSEDIHSWVESQLVDMIGPLGKKLHTGRSRNDQVTTDLKLWCKDTIPNILFSLKKIQCDLLRKAELLYDCIMPGYTHLQQAQPITFGYWCLAYLHMFKRDTNRLLDSLKRLDVSPLGSGALSGTFCSIDRDALAKRMNFNSSTENSLDAVSDRDYVLELLSVASISMIHLSRFSEDIIFFNSVECNFIELSDSITSGSSLMPQKKNPDALELIRGKTGRVHGYLLSMLTILKGLPLSYNKDMQEDKYLLFSAMNIWMNCLNITILVLRNMIVNKSICLHSAKKGYSNATEIADYLVNKGVSFREAHFIAGKIVLEAINQKCALEELNISTFKKYHFIFEEDIYNKLSLNSCLNSKNSKGGVSLRQILQSIYNIKKELY
ncbi:Argininosuccinate lyase [Buchnera aphidicola (Pterocallis alni)]|uniref:argininosuccinate lyase n=1 Tax=Buchnera aphidicola TaxID=9 RepID=UPI003464B2C1